MSAARIAIFVVVSAGILAFSWPSLGDPRRHGFPRCFAFEAILTLVLLNTGIWFREPFGARQIASWVLLMGSLGLALLGFVRLIAVGKPKGSFEDTTVLVATGVYRWIRHPLYASLVYGTWGVFLKAVTPTSIALTAAATLLLFATAKTEEAENLAKFGDGYRTYMARTRMFVPYLF